ncbi:MAG: CoA ester lyase, partial [Armatimonadetes bacterium]|nr:CoA ester lyase [Armatimonadota bacterium]NIM24768.1 CoA ester lyase [Armatimonadota bacterium]NIM68659.1 CoA ester lyase [Armatimonadota bacterium]NIN06861.1 CoA ester lyase [Armatimonadota bacterium]NIO98675.1 CoA ester lyase [Armatimonadota bacterium]
SGADVASVSERLSELESKQMERIGSLSIVPMIESAAGLLNAIDISRQASVLALAFGGLDYVRDLGVSLSE